MEEDVKCPFYVKGQAGKGYLLGVENVICSLEKCPFNKLQTIDWEGNPVTVCKSKGLLKITELKKAELLN